MSILKQLVFCVLLIAAATAGWYLYENPQMVGLAREAATPGTPGAGGGSAGRADRVPGLMGAGGAVNVVTAPVETDAGGETVLAVGTAKASQSITIFPQVTGMVTEILFTPGEMVDAGAVLVRLEDDEQRVAVDRARVTLEQAEKTLERSRKLAESKTITAVALSDAELAAQLAEIELRTANIALERRQIAAPFAGASGLTDLSVGDLVTNTTAITTLDDLSKLRVAFEVPERWAGRIAADQPIVATAQGVPGSAFSGRIAAIDNRVDATTRTLRLEAELENEGEVLKTGMAVNVGMEFSTSEQLAVPTLAVQWDRRGSFVWKIESSKAQRAEITILRRQSGIVMVQGELAAGDKVVIEGIQRLREGASVAEVNVTPGIVDDAGAAVARGGAAAPASEPTPPPSPERGTDRS